MAVSRERAQAAPDPATALLRQAKAGDARAQHNLAFHYEGERNYTQALEWYRKAAEQGYGISALNAGQMYETGQGVARDRAEALRLYRKSAEAGDAEAQWRTALLQEQLENDREAVRWLQRLAKDGDTRGMVQLAEHYERGHGVARDMRQALALYDRAAPNNPWAQFKVGIIYFEGNGVPRDHAAALRAFRGAGDRGHAPAMNNAGVMHEQGLGTAASDSAALDWYFKALSAGSNHALGNLDVFYARGRGAPPALPEAIAWYRRGAEAGVPGARFKLAELHERPGPTQDFNEALRWYERNVGDPRALRAAARLYRTGAVVWQPDSGNIAGRVLAAQYVADMLLREAEKAEAVPRPPPPSGMATEAGEDRQRAIKIRVANTGSMQAAAMDMGWSVVVIPPPPR
jgi:TPR repeat protein